MDAASDYTMFSQDMSTKYNSYGNGALLSGTTNNTLFDGTDANLTTMRLPTKSQFGEYGPVEQYSIFWVGKWIEKLHLRVLNAIGVPGNIAALVTIMSLKPISSPSLYIAFLALVDTLALVLLLISDELRKKKIHITHNGCRFQLFLGTTLLMLSNWTLVCLTVERFIAIWFPLQVNRICTKRKSIILICFLVTFFILLDLHFLFGYEESILTIGIYCLPKEGFQYFYTKIWYYIDFVFFALAPCAVLIVFNTLIIFRMKKSLHLQQAMAIRQDQLREKIKDQRQMTTMLCTISIVFILLILPNGIYYIYRYYWKISTLEEFALYVFVNNLINCLSSANHAINFYSYFLSAPRFREKFLKIFVCRKLKMSSLYKTSSVPTVPEANSMEVSSIQLSTNGANPRNRDVVELN